jgi:superfamily II DNA or RNA helicase
MSIARGVALWPHQRDAVDAALKTLMEHRRTSVIAACGSGKTRIGAEIAQRILPADGRLLIVAPTLELIAQTLHEYREAYGAVGVGQLIAVCSQHGAIYQSEVDLGAEHAEVTTDPQLLARLMSTPGRYTVACTYQSLAVLRAAHADHGLAPWSLITVDEAHRTAGVRDKPWAILHDDRAIPAKRRLYLTATPRVLADDDERALSMDEEEIFGPVSYRLGFADAIERGLLADYRVVVPVVTDAEVHRLVAAERARGPFLASGSLAVAPDMLAVQVAVLRAAAAHGLRRIITYHNTIEAADSFAATLHAAVGLLDEHERPPALTSRHVSGEQPVRKRRPILAQLGSDEPGVVVVSNARVLSEGVNIPAVDAVVFVDARDSTEMTVQAVGRALRTEGRAGKVATIIVPVILSSGQSPETALECSEFAPVWRTVRALRAHDDRLAVRLDKIRFDLGRDQSAEGGGGEMPDWLSFTGVPVPPGFAQAIALQMVRSATTPFEEMLGRATAYFERTGALVPAHHEDAELADWLRYQRALHTRGMLAPDRVAQLERIGMVWTVPDHRWAQSFSLARAFRATYGHLDVPDGAEVGNPPRPLGRWLCRQRQQHRAGALAPDRAAALEQLGIDWDPQQTLADKALRCARAYQLAHGHLSPAPADVWGEPPFAVGAWVSEQRALRRAGQLDPELAAALDGFAPRWDEENEPDEEWLDRLDVLSEYQIENDGALPTRAAMHGELWGEPATDVYGFLAEQRRDLRAGLLSARQITLLDTLGPGWSRGRRG